VDQAGTNVCPQVFLNDSDISLDMLNTYTPSERFLRIAMCSDFVMHSLLALSASHLSWLTACSATMHLAYQHRGLALKGLQKAIGSFCKENSDAVLAASILLSWQATDW
jgi:hypothetical protein